MLDSGGTTTVVWLGGGAPSPLLELQAARPNIARINAAGISVLCVIVKPKNVIGNYSTDLGQICVRKL